MAKIPVTFSSVADFKALHGVNKLHLFYNPDTDKFSLRLDENRVYIRIEADLVLNPELGAKATIDSTATMSVLCDDDSQGLNLDAVCVVKVKPSTLEDTGSAI